MSSQLKSVLAVVLLVAGVFGITFISKLSPKSDPKAPALNLAPLSIGVSEYQFNPDADDESYYNRFFPGFFEIGTGGSDIGSRNWVSFVMQNRQRETVFLAPKTACVSCTHARASTLPDEAISDFAGCAAAGQWIAGSGWPNPLAALAWADAVKSRQWFHFTMNNPKGTFPVPGTTNPDAPTWVFLELDYRASHETPPDSVKATFDLLNQKGEALRSPIEFKVKFAVRQPYELWPHDKIELGELPEGVASRATEVFVLSMTRGFETLPPPAASVGGDGKLVSIGEPVQLSAAECRQLVAKMGEKMGPVRVRAAYRYPITVTRPTEVGEFERDINFGSNLTPRSFRITIKANATGLVRIDGADKFDLGLYNSRNPLKKEFALVSANTDIELELVAERCGPKFVKLTLGEPMVAFGRKTWPLVATIGEQEGRNPTWTGEVVIRSKGPSPQVFRFPITGRGH